MSDVQVVLDLDINVVDRNDNEVEVDCVSIDGAEVLVDVNAPPPLESITVKMPDGQFTLLERHMDLSDPSNPIITINDNHSQPKPLLAKDAYILFMETDQPYPGAGCTISQNQSIPAIERTPLYTKYNPHCPPGHGKIRSISITELIKIYKKHIALQDKIKTLISDNKE